MNLLKKLFSLIMSPFSAIYSRITNIIDKKTFNWLLSVVIFLTILIIYNILYSKNDLRHFVVIEHISGSGQMSVVRDPGVYFVGANKATPWQYAKTFWFSEYDDEGGEKDISIPIQFYDGSTAKQGGVMVYMFDDNTKDSILVDLQRQYHSQDNFERSVVKPITTESLKKTASLMSSEDSYTTRKKEFGAMALDQLLNGTYLTVVTRDSITDVTGELIQADIPKIQVQEDKNKPDYQKPLRGGDKSLSAFSLSVPVFSLYECQYDSSVAARIETKRSSKMDKVISIAKTKLEKKDNYLAEIQGQVNVLTEKYLQMKNNAAKIVHAELQRDTSIIMANNNRLVAKIKASIATMKEQMQNQLGNKEVTVRSLLLGADNQLYARLDSYRDGQLRLADAFQNGKGIFPEVVLSIGGKTTQTISDQAMQWQMLNQANSYLENTKPQK